MATIVKTKLIGHLFIKTCDITQNNIILQVRTNMRLSNQLSFRSPLFYVVKHWEVEREVQIGEEKTITFISRYTSCKWYGKAWFVHAWFFGFFKIKTKLSRREPQLFYIQRRLTILLFIKTIGECHGMTSWKQFVHFKFLHNVNEI